MLPREDGGVVDNKLKVSMISFTHRYLSTHWLIGIRDNKRPGHGHFNYSSSHRSTPARYAIFIIPFLESIHLSTPYYTQRLRMLLESWGLILSETASIFELKNRTRNDISAPTCCLPLVPRWNILLFGSLMMARVK